MKKDIAKIKEVKEKSNFEKWKDFLDGLPPFMCIRFCEVLAKKFDEVGFDADKIYKEVCGEGEN